MNKQRMKSSKSAMNTRIIYLFEYVSGSKSSFEYLNISKNFIEPKYFISLKVSPALKKLFLKRQNIIWILFNQLAKEALLKNKENLFFNLENIIALKILDVNDGHIFYFMSTTTEQDEWQIESILLQSLRQFRNFVIPSRIKDNNIIFKYCEENSSVKMCTLNNISIITNDLDKSQSNCQSFL